jgi:hypothetical protein
MIKLFRKKIIVIEAVRFDGTNMMEIIQDFGVKNIGDITQSGPFLNIRTLEGIMRAAEGDYIIRGIKGELYPCKSDIFALTYDEVE